MKKKPIIAIVGPTAVGKTKLSIELAKTYHGEIISGDSMQVYKGMDIGTAKVTQAEMDGIIHHMIDVKEPCEAFTAAEFQTETTRLIDAIHAKGKLPIIVGGSGLYIQSVLYEYDFSKQARDLEVTQRLEAELNTYGAAALHQRLQEIDPQQAEKIHPNNHRRLIRALEVFETTGKRLSDSADAENLLESAYEPLIIGLEMERSLLYARINARVDKMMAEGLVKEVERLVALGYENCQAMQAIGYKEIVPYIKQEISLEQAVELLKRNSRRFAKRQYTWFKNKMDTKWYPVHPETVVKNFAEISKDLAGFLQTAEK